MTTPEIPDNALQALTDRELLEHLTETDVQLERLQREVHRRMQARAKAEHRIEQHAEISRMVEHLEQTSVDWRKVREFFRDSIVEAQEPWGRN